MSRIYWDAMLFVYWLENNPAYIDRLTEIRDKMLERQDTLCTSVFTIGEVLAGPYKRGELNRAREALKFFGPPYVEVLPFTKEVANRYGQIRGARRIASADAIHLACAAEAGVNLFLTNDHHLQRLIIPGIHFIAGLDVDLF